MITLRSDRLRLEIAQPLEAPNRTFRFDRAGFITEVVLDGSVRFCASEPQNLSHPSSGGRGMCSEYTADFSQNARPGEYYPKLGVGLIRRDQEPYVFFKQYGDVQDYPVEVDAGEDWARFSTGALPCGGTAVSFVKTIRLSGNAVTVETCAVNGGSVPVETLEYCHNFFSIDGMAISPEYELELPDLPDLGTEQKLNIHGEPCNWRGNGRGLTFQRCTTDCAHIRVPLDGLREGDAFHWTLRHRGAKAWVAVTEFFRPVKMEIWAIDHIVSPEVFHALSLRPGESTSWTRRWTFGKDY